MNRPNFSSYDEILFSLKYGWVGQFAISKYFLVFAGPIVGVGFKQRISDNVENKINTQDGMDFLLNIDARGGAVFLIKNHAVRFDIKVNSYLSQTASRWTDVNFKYYYYF